MEIRHRPQHAGFVDISWFFISTFLIFSLYVFHHLFPCCIPFLYPYEVTNFNRAYCHSIFAFTTDSHSKIHHIRSIQLDTMKISHRRGSLRLSTLFCDPLPSGIASTNLEFWGRQKRRRPLL